MGQGDVEVVTDDFGDDRYRITATAEFDATATRVWELLLDWEQFVAVGLPGMTGDFEWLSGGPTQVPSTFQFAIAGATLKEEIYECATDAGYGKYSLRYRALEPALGVVEYDAILELQQLAGARTGFQAVREVRLEPGASPDMLTEMVRSETQCLKEHYKS